MRPAHRKPLHPARIHCQARRLSTPVPAAASRGEYRCPAEPRPGPRRGGPRSPAAACFLPVRAPRPTSPRPGSPGHRQPPPLGPAPLPRPPPPPAPPAAPPGNYRSAPTSGQLPGARTARRPASPGGRKRLTPPARAPGRAPSWDVPAPRPRPQAEPLTRALPRHPPSRTNSRLRSLRTGHPSPRRPVRAPPPPPHPPPSLTRARPPRASRPGPLPVPRPRRGAAPAPLCAPAAPSAPRPPPPPPLGGSRQPSPRLQILPRRLCSTRTSRLSSSPASGSAVAVAAGASEAAAAAAASGAAAAAAAMVLPGPCRSPAACVAGEAEPSGRVRAPRAWPRPPASASAARPAPAPPRAAPPRPTRPAQSPPSYAEPGRRPRGNCTPGFPALCPIKAGALAKRGSQVLAASSLETRLERTPALPKPPSPPGTYALHRPTSLS